MKHWKPWTLAAAALVVALLALLWRQFSPADLAYRHYISSRIEETIDFLETDPTAYRSDTQDAVRVVAAAAAEGKINPPEALYVLAAQYEREGDYETAEMVYREVMEMAPGWSWPYVALGILLARYGQERMDEAELLLLAGVELQPDWVRPYNSLGVVLRLQGRFEEAEAMALQALELAPYDVAAHNNYANLLVVQGRYEEAQLHYVYAMESEPENAKPPYNLACLYTSVGDFEEACAYLEIAIILSETSRMDATIDPYFDPIRHHPCFQALVYGIPGDPGSGEMDAWEGEAEEGGDAESAPPGERDP